MTCWILDAFFQDLYQVGIIKGARAGPCQTSENPFTWFFWYTIFFILNASAKLPKINLLRVFISKYTLEELVGPSTVSLRDGRVEAVQ